ncbi:MAG: glycosyltransferase family 4 protein, partial [Rikenellaceae bacterium]
GKDSDISGKNLTFVDKIAIMKDKILITAPLPPPIHGMSIATKMLIDGLTDYDIVTIDTTMDRKHIINKQPSPFHPKRFGSILQKLFVDSFRMLTTSYDLHYICTGIDFRGVVRFLPYVIISRLKRKPYYIHVHNSSFRTMYDSLSGNKQRIVRFIFGNAAGVIALGESLKKLFDGVVAEEHLYVVENCVDNEFFSSQEEIEKKHKRPTNTRKILYLSNLMRDKGIFELMEAAAEIKNCELHIAGAIEQNPQSAAKVKEMLEKHKDKFFYHGIVAGEAKKTLLKECDIFALPSRSEGQPISILEAYANGLAVVTDEECGGIRDIFCDGVNGYSCTAGDVESIKKAIEKTSDSLSDFIEPNYKYALSKFKRSDFIARVRAVFSND